MYILVSSRGGGGGGGGVEGYIFMEKSPGFEIGKLGNYERPHIRVSGTGRYFIDLLLKKLEKSAAFLGIRKERGDISQR